MKGITVLLAAISAFAIANPADVKVKVGNEAVVFDAEPTKINGIVMVPLRSIVDSMQGTMRWDPSTKVVNVWSNSRRFDMVLNSRDARVNDKAMAMEEAPLIRKNRIYVPIKFIADASGYLISSEDGWLVLRPARK